MEPEATKAPLPWCSPVGKSATRPMRSWDAGRSLPLRQGACALPYHRQHHLGCPRSRNRRRARRHLLVLARKPLGAHQLYARRSRPRCQTPGHHRGRGGTDAALMGEPSADSTQVPEPPYAHGSLDWHDWWCSDDAAIYQFIGQDNIYFYCIAQTAMWEALDWNLHQSTVSANYHLLYMGKKASSSSQTPPPPADDLLNHYTCEQMRAHWLSLGLSEKPVSFSPKAYDTRVSGKDKDGNEIRACDDKRVIDPALKGRASHRRVQPPCPLLLLRCRRKGRRRGKLPHWLHPQASPAPRSWRPLSRPPSPSSSTCTSSRRTTLFRYATSISRCEQALVRCLQGRKERRGRQRHDAGSRQRLPRATRSDHPHAWHCSRRLRAHLRILRHRPRCLL